MALFGERSETLTNESQLRFWYILYILYMAKFKEVHSTSNVNFSTGARNLGQMIWNNARKRRENGKELQTQYGIDVPVRFSKVSQVHLFFSDGGKLTSLMHCSS